MMEYDFWWALGIRHYWIDGGQGIWVTLKPVPKNLAFTGHAAFPMIGLRK